jgi:hypothetical protein
VAAVRWYPCAKDAGNGSLRSALAAIRSGSVTLVVLVARRISHSESSAILAASRRTSVPLLLVAGGLAAVARAVAAHVDGGTPHEW